MKCVRLHPEATIIQSDRGILLYGSSGHFLVEGRDAASAAEILPLIDGTRTPGDIAAAFPDFSASSVIGWIDSLARYGIVEQIAPENQSPDRKIQSARVLLVGLSQLGIAA